MENIIGHEKVKLLLKKIVDEDKVLHSYMFVGKEGIGKKLLAIEFAKMIMNSNGGIYNEEDIKIVSPDKNMIKVEEIRNLISDIYLKPTNSSKKVLIVDDADKMNLNAQNALLKVLEEPPIYAVIILIVSSKEKIIKTILSRTTEITFESLTTDELKRILGDEAKLDYAVGSVSRAVLLLQNDNYKISEELTKAIDSKNLLELNRKINELKNGDNDIINALEIAKIIYHKNLKEDTYEKVRKIELIDRTINNLARNANTDLALDKLMIELCNM